MAYNGHEYPSNIRAYHDEIGRYQLLERLKIRLIRDLPIGVYARSHPSS